MPPEQRERMLRRLPPERRAAVEERMDRLNNLPPDAKKRLRKEFDHFQQLSEENQETVRKNFRLFNELPKERRPEVRRELNDLRRMSAAERQTRFSSEEFRHKFEPNEQGILETLSGLLGP
jgi:flagellar motor switch protein FliG